MKPSGIAEHQVGIPEQFVGKYLQKNDQSKKKQPITFSSNTQESERISLGNRKGQ
ncbi:hypothetical protein Q7O_004416 [Pectobacterium carotovorum subsp. carotovorum PCCS1]|nr:hypothetical protein [Pectobacterium carotovorum subsp. carotovorum PCCS1]